MSLTTNKLDVWCHYDSDVSDDFGINFQGAEKRVKITVPYLKFTLPNNETYSDPTAYLFIAMNNLIVTSSINQLGKKPKGAIFPIHDPVGGTKVDAYAKGIYGGPDSLKFSICDKQLKEVAVTRLVVTFHIVEETV